jgi:hypothetical protein
MQTPDMQTLSDAELDAVAAGASANLAITNIFASGPGGADVSATDVFVGTAVVGGLTPSQQSLISGTFTSSASF